MNLTLEQAMARATKGPLIVLDGEEQTERDVAHIPHSGIILKTVAEKPSLQDQINAGPVNAGLLAHWYSVGPELVDSMNHAFRQIACREGQLSENEKLAMRTLQSAIARANTVTIPD